jgi:signal transduction histidine kinase
VVDVALHNLSQAILDSGAEIETRINPLEIDGDRHQAVQLLQNIIENALKYRKTGHAPKVQIISVESDGAPARLQIRDHGVGFPANRSDEIFEPFKRLHTRDVYSGSGLGLAICKAIAGRHGWRVSATSTLDAGSCFEIVFSRDHARQ